MSRQSILRNATQILALLTFFVLGFAAWGFAADAKETIDATARGTSTQMGRDISIKVLIYSYSTEEDRQTLKAAFAKGQSQGLADALSKMKAVGRIQIPGTLGYELGYVRRCHPTPTGRKIRFAANRKIAFGEAYGNTQSQAFNLTAGEFDLNDKDKNKSTGVLFPATQRIDQQGRGNFQFGALSEPVEPDQHHRLECKRIAGINECVGVPGLGSRRWYNATNQPRKRQQRLVRFQGCCRPRTVLKGHGFSRAVIQSSELGL